MLFNCESLYLIVQNDVAQSCQSEKFFKTPRDPTQIHLSLQSRKRRCRFPTNDSIKKTNDAQAFQRLSNFGDLIKYISNTMINCPAIVRSPYM